VGARKARWAAGCGPTQLHLRSRLPWTRSAQGKKTGEATSTWSGDFGGGALYSWGRIAALMESKRSGTDRGRCATCENGASIVMFDVSSVGRRRTMDRNSNSNFLDGGAQFYGVYECAAPINFDRNRSARFMRICASTSGFRRGSDAQMDARHGLRSGKTGPMCSKDQPRKEWSSSGRPDVCFAPVLTERSAPSIAKTPMAARKIFVSRTASPSPPRRRGLPHTMAIREA